MIFQFSKMHSLGNDFMIIDGVNQTINLTIPQIQYLGDRHLGVGFDQLLLIEPATNKNSDFSYRIFNADGNEVSQCGNGARCLGSFLHEKKLSHSTLIRLETKNRIITVEKKGKNNYSVDMGFPEFEPAKIPFTTEQQQTIYEIKISNKVLHGCALSLGNPHLVIIDGFEEEDLNFLGSFLMKHSAFPQGVNVGFLKIKNRDAIDLRVFERGVGETQACGSGACAAFISGRLLNKLNETVSVHLLGGQLSVSWSSDRGVILSGETTHVFDGVLHSDSMLKIS